MVGSEGDLALVEAARNGNREAMAMLLTRHRPLLLAVCRRALEDVNLAEDAAQEACLQAFLSVKRLRDPASFGSWLAGIGLNCCHRLRRQRLREAWSWEALQGGMRLPDDLVDREPGPEARAEVVELWSWIDGAVAALPPRQRAAVSLHYLAGLTQTETAALLGIQVGAVKTRLHNARTQLRRDLEQQAAPWLHHEGGFPVSDLVEMHVADVRRRPAAGGQEARHFVVLAEVTGERRMPIWIGESEAIAMALHVEEVPQARPLTYAFAAEIFRAAQGQLREVRVDRLHEDIFYATALVTGPAGSRTVDARPSDALNLALVLGAPIRVAEVVLAATAEPTAEEWARRDELTEGAAAIVRPVVAAWGNPKDSSVDTLPA